MGWGSIFKQWKQAWEVGALHLLASVHSLGTSSQVPQKIGYLSIFSQPHRPDFCSWYPQSLTGQDNKTLPWASTGIGGLGYSHTCYVSISQMTSLLRTSVPSLICKVELLPASPEYTTAPLLFQSCTRRQRPSLVPCPNSCAYWLEPERKLVRHL